MPSSSSNLLSALPLDRSAAPVRAIVLMIVSGLLLTLNDAIAKWLTAHYPIGQLMAARGGLVVVIAILWAFVIRRPQSLVIYRWGPQVTRGVLMVVSTFLFVTGLSLLPIADAIAITFAGPIFATALAALLLKEPVGWRRWTAVGVGFAGVLIMVRPAPDVVQWAALVPLAAAFIGAFRDIITRTMSAGGESTLATLVVSTGIVSLGRLLTLPWGWEPVTLEHWGLFAASAVLVAIAQACMIESFRWGEVGLVGPFKYVSLVWAVLAGLIIWGDIPSVLTILGSAIVIGSGLYIWWRETRVRRG